MEESEIDEVAMGVWKFKKHPVALTSLQHWLISLASSKISNVIKKHRGSGYHRKKNHWTYLMICLYPEAGELIAW